MQKRSQYIKVPALCLLILATACGKASENGPASVSEQVPAAAAEAGSGKAPYTEIWGTYQAALPEGKEEAAVFVEPIEGLSEDFVRGVDISSVIVEEESGVKYYDENGSERDIFEILADAGVNYVRVRIWNHPYDADGNGYGGGNCDTEKAAQIGKRAAEHGMRLLVDFHYSDFWADPNKQYAPTEWARKDPEEKAALIEEFTAQSLETIYAAGARIGMVQTGNEINSGMCGVYVDEDKMSLLSAASRAIRAFSAKHDEEIRIAIHYTQVDDAAGMLKKAGQLKEHSVDYDVFGISYYPYWHGTLENMRDVLKSIHAQYGVDTCVLETSYLSTDGDGDGFANSVAAEEALTAYPADPQGQAKMVRDVCAYANEAGALGVFYWEPAWVPVGSDFESNKPIWEAHGSGWASSYATKYDPQDAGKYFGGSSWDNQAMFDDSGKALPSVNVFRWLYHGTSAPLQTLAYEEVYMESGIGEEILLPEEIKVYYNDPSVEGTMQVEWDAEELAAVDVNTGALYEVQGTAEDGAEVTAQIKVMNVNYLKDPGFDEADHSVWQVEDRGAGNTTDIQKKAADALSDEYAFHFYSTEAIDFDVFQTVTVAAEGTYSAAAGVQGGDMGADHKVVLFAKVGDAYYASEPVMLDGWRSWKQLSLEGIPLKAGDEVTIGISVQGAAKGWGTIDDVELFK
ncbi:MAG: glycosyl hydrolase 53 family protein [Lachnospiraceae bacterium]|nr:glycosyl hydrolase 53 family protein [Lachnospiraceae bacterium]